MYFFIKLYNRVSISSTNTIFIFTTTRLHSALKTKCSFSDFEEVILLIDQNTPFATFLSLYERLHVF